jgi:hypothetical protein
MTNSGEPSPDYLRRLREFQLQVRSKPRSTVAPVVPARGPLSSRQRNVLERLRRLSVALAESFEQALRDLNDHARLSYMGPAGEVREVLRATIQQLAPDADVRAQSWYKGHEQGGKINPTQAERTRYAVQVRGGSIDQAKASDELIEELIGKVSRETYQVGSRSFHAGAVQGEVEKLTGWIFSLLDEVLPD